MIVSEINANDFFNLDFSLKKENEDLKSIKKQKNLEKNLEKIDHERNTIIIDNEELFIGNRIRMKENFNRMKEDQLVEIIGFNKKGEIQVCSVYDHSKEFVTIEQVYYNEKQGEKL
jgi:hypothetical protein